MRADEAFRLLGLSDAARCTRAEMRAAFKRLICRTHPDKVTRPDAQCLEQTRRLIEAKKVLEAYFTAKVASSHADTWREAQRARRAATNEERERLWRAHCLRRTADSTPNPSPWKPVGASVEARRRAYATRSNNVN